uniref:Retrovirus-related Pol polyprotein from transposon TNT 1-94 n=1 Tax=Tanacetum cinerariifolium TaxID=118510 RepID=A0A699GJ92_TANCI|nr:retrovirus-related Pol polyprotein from transposon TNT 1-94 [Tanacetum cinerariifolium]
MRDHLGKFDEKADDGFFLGYSSVAKAFRVFNIRIQEIEETFHVTFSKDDEAILQTSTEGDAINFNEVNSFPDDEFYEPTISDTLSLNEVVHSDSADVSELADLQEDDRDETLIVVQPLPQINSLVFRNKMDKEGVVTKNKARLVAKGYKQEKGFQIKQYSKGISICQEKYIKDLLKKYDLPDCALVKCPMLLRNNLGSDESGVFVNEIQFRGMIGSLMYLIASRPDIQFFTCLCARYQANPKESHLVAVKRIFRYFKAKTEYVAAAGCCAQVLWIKSQLADYDVLYDKLLSLKPYKITAVTLRTPLKNETPLTTHMCNVTEISPQPLQSLIPPSGEVNVDDSANKSLFGNSVPPVTQSKETTARKPILNTIVEENVEEKEKAEDHSLDILTVEHLLDKVDKQNSTVQHTQESLFDIESEILFVKSFQASQITKDVEPLRPLSLIQVMMSLTQNTHHGKRLLFAEFQSLSGHLDHVYLINHSLKAQLLGLLSDTLKNSLPKLLKESLTPLIRFVFESVTEEQDQLNKWVVKHMNRQFNIAHKAESLWRTLEAVVIVDDHAEGDKSKEGQMDENTNLTTTQDEHSNVEENAAIPYTSQGEHKSDNANISSANKETTLVIHQTANMKTTEDDTDYDELDKEPLSKKFKIMTLIPNFPTPTLLFSPAPLKEPSPPRDPVKGKCVDIEEPVNVLVPFMDEGGSNPKIPSLKPFMNIEGVSTQEEFIKQLAKIKSLKSKFQWVLNQAKNLGVPPPHALATFGMTAEDKKRKRNEILKEVFVKERINVDGT